MRCRFHFAALCFVLLCIGARPVAAGPIRDRIYPAPTAPLSLSGLPAGATLIEVRTADGLVLKGIARPARPGRPTLLVFHGNGSSAADAMTWLHAVAEQGWGIVAAEYRGYSANPGTPSETGLAADADAFHAFARAQGGPLWVVGHSLGGGVALALSRRQRLDAVITVGTFTRLRAMAPKLARSFVPDAYDNKAAIAVLDEPYFLVHGTHDATVPVAQGEALHGAAGAAKARGASFVVIGADHKPAGAQMLAILSAATRILADGQYGADLVPTEIKLVPFGQKQPVNP
ncbi:alpha/beta hydrolase [Allosphingosinicella deserti]|uniref:Alpha/beta hydrolase n=1 Tax=Allosphingosinicella deserti TaxID=2116704 RepID=A0A2P7QKN9_9SPHN|nr:alpha/beta hydrolase [Sphingomonas deserti]PSJ38516.1 alpha/beta hydrolase [Sphingomonas deserti]